MSSVTFHPAAPDEFLPALQLLFGAAAGADRAEQYRSVLAPDNRSPEGLFVAREGNRLVGAMLAQKLSGALGITWPPHAPTPEIEDTLITMATNWLWTSGVKVCQAFAAEEELPGLVSLVRHGFRRVTELVFMRRELVPDAPLPEPVHPIIFIPESPPFSKEFRQALLDTHERSMDCPELNGERTADEVVAAFSDWGSGNEWYLAVDRDVVLGVVLFAAGTETNEIELSYLGVVPLFRRCGYGNELLEFAIAAATLAKMTALTVSVDARNEPAMALYRKHGFVEIHRQWVFLVQWASPTQSEVPDNRPAEV
jgi:ribosomal protein S18 acetylase RimI-like enzyme